MEILASTTMLNNYCNNNKNYHNPNQQIKKCRVCGDKAIGI